MKRQRLGIGFRVGMLEVVSPTDQRNNGYTIWRCKCDCSGERLMDTRTLQRGTIRDCGCLTKTPPGANDLSGKRFGRLIALNPSDRREHGSIVWRCRCDCGKEAYVSTKQLASGNTKSCGCLGHPPVKDYIGKRFGKLTVESYEGKREGHHFWHCKCDCGNETVVRQGALQTGKTKSCGCLQAESVRENLKLVDGTSVVLLEAHKKKLASTNTSGYVGVYQNKKSGRWQSQITFKGKTYYLGSFKTKEEAVRARKKGEEMHDDFLAQYYATHGLADSEEK